MINNGTAAEKFDKMVHALGGPMNILESYNNHLPRASHNNQVLAEQTGFIQSIETRKLGLLLIELGGGRKQIKDSIDYSVGFENVIGVGDYVESTSPLLTLHSSSKDDFDSLKKQIQECFKISKSKSEKLDIIYQTIK